MTTEPKHTPGPWCFYASPVGLPGLTWSIYADVNTGTDGPDAAQHLAEVFGQDAFTNNANAALIASAPSILADNERLREALRQALPVLTWASKHSKGNCPEGTLTQARAALSGGNEK